MITATHGIIQSIKSSPVLDLLSAGSISAFSLNRRLLTSYSGNLFDVQRSSDNAVQSIGFLSSGDVATSTLTTFVGADTGVITKIYDQLGTNHVIQNTATQQPIIINAGTLQTVNGKLCVVFDGVNDTMFNTPSTTSQPWSRNAVWRRDSVLTTTSHHFNNSSSPSTQFFSAPSSSSIRANYGSNSGASSWVAGFFGVSTELANGTSSNWFKNGTSVGVTNTGTNSLNGFRIGSSTGGTVFSTMSFCEAVLFASNLSTSDRQILERNQGAYYGITVA
jgi:hypothetical protein